MTVIGWIQILLYCLIIVALTPLVGGYMTRAFSGEHRGRLRILVEGGESVPIGTEADSKGAGSDGAEAGQANPAESQRIRKSLADLPVVQVVSAVDPGKRLGFLPHATLVGWLSEKEILIVENHFLAAYDVTSGARRKSAIRVDDPSFVFVR